MYLPKSKYTGNLYSNGNFVYANTLKPYVGYLYTTTSGESYTGRYPGDQNDIRLILTEETEEGEVIYGTDQRLAGIGLEYSLLKYNGNLPPLSSPTPYYPDPTESDYKTGEFVRYFTKRINEEVYIETSALFSNSYYISITLPWLLVGDKDKVYQINKNMVDLKEQELSINGLGAYLKFNYLKYYK